MNISHILAATALLLPAFVGAQQFDLRLTSVVSNVQGVVDIVHAGSDSGMIYLVQQRGTVQMARDGVVRETRFADLSDRITTSGSEQGLLSMVFAPDYPATPHVFVWYIARSDNASVLARFTVNTASNTLDLDSEQVVLRVDTPFANHNGGKLLFGPDGMLYLSTGDGGGADDPARTAQDLGSLLGKILRLDVSTLPYSIPPDNPFVNQAGARPEIWSYGLRNPWRMSFDRSTGELWIADVGESQREEINVQPAGVGGQNWGWSCFEGTLPFPQGDTCRGSAPVPPIAEYGRAEGCSITGGYVYRGTKYPALQGVYLAGDFCSGKIFGLKRGDGGFALQELLDTSLNITTFGEDPAGDIYVAGQYSDIHVLSDGPLQETTEIDASQVGTQFWLTGNGTVSNRVLGAQLSSSTGAAFGGAFDPADVVLKPWGRIEIEFTGCDNAILRWDSTGPDSAGFGSGGYPLERIAPSNASQNCNQLGIDGVDNQDWISGTWFGGAARNGEGLFLEHLANGMVLVGFFTHRPAGLP